MQTAPEFRPDLEDAGSTSTRYHYTRVVEIAGRTVRTRVERGVSLHDSFAVAEVLSEDHATWSSLAADDVLHNWWHSTPAPSPDVHAATVLGPVTERLLRRAADILAAPPAMLTLSPHVHGAISALLATSWGFDAERRIEPAEIAWAYAHGGRLHIIEHPDGSVTFTKSHRDACPFIVSNGGQDCDEDCVFGLPRRT